MNTEQSSILKTSFERREIMWSFYVDMERGLENKLDDWRKDLRNNNMQDMRPQLERINLVYTNLLREGVLVQVCSIVEHTITLIGELLVPQYEQKYDGTKGNWLKRNLAVWGISKNIDHETNDIFTCLITLRNCCVHAGGKILKYKRQQQLRKAVKKLKDLKKRENTELVSETNDGYILLGTHIISEAVARGEEIVKTIIQHTLDNKL